MLWTHFGIDLHIRNVSIFLCRFNWHVYYAQAQALIFPLPEVSTCVHCTLFARLAHVKTEIILGWQRHRGMSFLPFAEHSALSIPIHSIHCIHLLVFCSPAFVHCYAKHFWTVLRSLLLLWLVWLACAYCTSVKVTNLHNKTVSSVLHLVSLTFY